LFILIHSIILKYLFGPFLDNLRTIWYNDGFNANSVEDISEFINNENRMMGIPRLRQVRVKNDSCSVPEDFQQEIKVCFSDWAASVEDKLPFGQAISYAAKNLTNYTTA
jgi:polycystin 2